MYILGITAPISWNNAADLLKMASLLLQLKKSASPVLNTRLDSLP